MRLTTILAHTNQVLMRYPSDEDALAIRRLIKQRLIENANKTRQRRAKKKKEGKKP